MIRLLRYGLPLVFAVGCFIAAKNADSSAAYPQSVVRELSRKVSPVLQLRSVHKVVDATGIVHLSIEARDLEIDIEKSTSSARNEFRFELEGRFAVENKEPLALTQTEGALKVSVLENLRRKQWLSQLSGPMNGNRLRILLPPSYSGSLFVRSTAGKTNLISVGGLSELDWESVSGDLLVSNSEVFVARLSSVSGAIKYEAATSELNAQLTSGDAHFRVSGLDRYLGAKLDLFSTAGQLKIEIPRTSTLRYSLSSLTGTLRSELPGKPSAERGGGQTLEGQLGRGEGELRARTISGDLNVGYSQ